MGSDVSFACAGLVNVRKNVGGGSFLAGYKRAYADYSTFELHAAAGLKTLLTASSGVQLSQHAHASLTATWQPQAGMGLQVMSAALAAARCHSTLVFAPGAALVLLACAERG